MKDNI